MHSRRVVCGPAGRRGSLPCEADGRTVIRDSRWDGENLVSSISVCNMSLCAKEKTLFTQDT